MANCQEPDKHCIKVAATSQVAPLPPPDEDSDGATRDKEAPKVAVKEMPSGAGGKPSGGDGAGAEEAGERNLDSGYAWLILAVMFLLASSTGGTNRVYGLIYAKQVAIGYYDREQASWPIATASTVENLAGLLTPALAQTLTWRQMELLATLLFVAANLGAYFSDSLVLDILWLGIVQGLALSINTVLSLVINNDYFRRYRTTAYGISLSGSTFGILYLGPLVSWCLERDELHFRSGYLAIGAVLALNALLVIFIRPRDKSPTNKGSAAASSSVKSSSKSAASTSSPRASLSQTPAAKVAPLAGGGAARKLSLLERHLERKNSVASIALMCKQRRQTQLQRKPSMLPANSPATGGQPQQPGGDQWLANMMMAAGGEKKKSTASVFHTRLSFVANDSAAAARPESRASLCRPSADLEQLAAFEAFDEAHRGSIQDQELDCENQDQDEEEGLSARLVGALLRSPYLHCVWIMLSLYYLIARIFIIILVDLAKDNGLSSGESRALLNCWSVGEIVGRIVLCSFVDLQWLSVRACILLTCSSMSACIAAMALLHGSFYLYAACSALVAALISLEYVLINVLMIEYLGQSRVTSCYSVGSFVSSLALLGRPALIGLFRDQLGSYNGLLLLLAGLALAFGLLFGLLEPLLVRYWPKRQLFHRKQLLH